MQLRQIAQDKRGISKAGWIAIAVVIILIIIALIALVPDTDTSSDTDASSVDSAPDSSYQNLQSDDDDFTALEDSSNYLD
ncbi:hypothetical protein HYZ97_01910 [Candidatus Pacearchaeota archaeon]|nr:hypothetical protein [Candidatus Pacearchaeota archaeon]